MALVRTKPNSTDLAAFAVLGLPTTATVQEVDSAWRTLRRTAHPDHEHGNVLKFTALKKAYDAARFVALLPKQCPTCEGVGLVSARAGSFKYEKCTTCDGKKVIAS